ncbi:glycoside hydrolase family 26 protein [Lysinibacter cavernae]|uniref:GH26 domain-containing protein n=1 Tax=Lysinibacter cavernae TaxID=1640652 RepID=A0A7X5R108_9MICO|nr:glycosyl hydrolase [Lysinibacter cavernae]NIH53517.1 hypothetical protein [Lysinibacter cavernae]
MTQLPRRSELRAKRNSMRHFVLAGVVLIAVSATVLLADGQTLAGITNSSPAEAGQLVGSPVPSATPTPGAERATPPTPSGDPSAVPSASELGNVSLSPEALAVSPNKVVGVFSNGLPYGQQEYDNYVELAGASPNVINFFTKWDEPFRIDGADAAYAKGAFPMISWESWAKGSPTADPNYSLQNILNGQFDGYIRDFADDVAAYDKTVLLRLNHEMNGKWYPWSVGVNGNTAEQYVAVWRHVHDIFAEEQADNVAWIWSVNVQRAIPESSVPLQPLYPGDDYVDFTGITGYSVGEATANELFGPTLGVIRTFSTKRTMLTEVGAQSYGGKTAFISSLFSYVNSDPNIVGFVWFQTTVKTGGKSDWIFSDNQANIDAYRAGVAATPLVSALPRGETVGSR